MHKNRIRSPKEMSNTPKFQESSGNIFLDIGFTAEEAEQAQRRVDLAFEVHARLNERNLTSTETQQLLKLNPSEASHIKNGDFEHFTLERLTTILNQLNRITPSDSTTDHQVVIAT